MRRFYGKPLPSKRAIRANLFFLNYGNVDDYTTQCNDCIHALNGRYDFNNQWCHEFDNAPLGVCLQKEPVK